MFHNFVHSELRKICIFHRRNLAALPINPNSFFRCFLKMSEPHCHRQLRAGCTSKTFWNLEKKKEKKKSSTQQTSEASSIHTFMLKKKTKPVQLQTDLLHLSLTSSSSSSHGLLSGSWRCWEAKKLNMSNVFFLQDKKQVFFVMDIHMHHRMHPWEPQRTPKPGQTLSSI